MCKKAYSSPELELLEIELLKDVLALSVTTPEVPAVTEFASEEELFGDDDPGVGSDGDYFPDF